MEHTITPPKSFIKTTSKTAAACLQESLHIDYYQREYNWEEKNVKILLDDIFNLFNQTEHSKASIDDCEEKLNKWYYLGIYITTESDGKKYIMDGQQRLSTLTLIIIKLYHMLDRMKNKPNNSKIENIQKSLECCISAPIGANKIFNLHHEKRQRVMEHLFEYGGEIDKKPFKDTENTTEDNLYKRYKEISKYLDNKKEDDNTIAVFALYLLYRVALVELTITPDDAPMIFEVINDRGKPLQPHEILKGSLIGRLDNNKKEEYAEKWDKALYSFGKNNQINEFFNSWVRAKCFKSKGVSEAENIQNRYHKFLLENKNAEEKFFEGDSKKSENIKNFIDKTLPYYAKLYFKISTHKPEENHPLTYVKINTWHEMTYQNILAACKVDDPKEDDKIHLIAKAHDKINTLLYLNGIHASNTTSKIFYELNEKLQSDENNEGQMPLNKYQFLFDEKVKEVLENADSLLDYGKFSNANFIPRGKNFVRYFLARIEKHLCEVAKDPLESSKFYNFCKQTGRNQEDGGKNGYDIEHIFSNHPDNIEEYFADKIEFDGKRNTLGALLLLEGSRNRSLSDDLYENKVESYRNSPFLWNRLLSSEYQKDKSDPKLKKLKEYAKENNLEFKPYDKFDKQALEERTKLLYELVKIIWEVE